jgi:dihydroorotate dehydrogenase (NAD+) catalytic subunit
MSDMLSTTFCNVQFPNPLILPSGIAQEIPNDHLRAVEAGAGGITTKSLTVEPREGNPLPRLISTELGFLNSVGLRGPGIKKGVLALEECIKLSSVPVIVSIFATSIKDFELLASAIVPIQPQIIELNLSCPNVKGDMGKPLGTGVSSVEQTVCAVKKLTGKIPLLAKLSQNVADIGELAKAGEAAGADGIVAINTIPAMAINITTRRPILGAKRGGLSGPPIKPAAVFAVYEIYQSVKIPIIGVGGVTTWQDVVEMLLAGATLVGIGSATYKHGMRIYRSLQEELEAYLKKENIHHISELTGKAHHDVPKQT